MAKMFYTLDETKAALGQSEDQIKQLTREGRLREFRDGPRLMFKADQVDALKSQIGGGGGVEMHDSGLPIGLADTGSASGTGLNMADSVGASPSGSGLAGISGSGLSGISGSGLSGISGSGLGSGLTGGAGSGMMNLKEDTALAADLGLSGTVGGIPSPGRSGTGSGSGSGVSGGSVGSRQGINVFGDDTHAGADPLAQTAMPNAGSMADLNLEGIGSGSGLLDLTRESDETSLGAELLDEISPGGGGKGGRPMAPPDTGSMAGIKLDAPRGGVVRGGGVQQVEAADPWEAAFGAMSLGVAFVLLFAVFALANAAMGYQPDAVKYFSDKDNAFELIVGVGLGVAVLFLAFGKLISMSGSRR